MRHSFILLQLIFAVIISGYAQNRTDTTISKSYPVVISSDTLFFISEGIGPITAEERAAAINRNLNYLLEKNVDNDSIVVVEDGDFRHLKAGSLTIMSLMQKDTANTGLNRDELAVYYAGKIDSSITKYFAERSSERLLWNAGKVVLLLALSILIFWLLKLIFPLFYKWLEVWERQKIKPVNIKSHEIISREDIISFLILIVKGIRLALSLVVIYYFIIISLSLFPWTSRWNVSPYLKGFFYSIVATAAVYAIIKTALVFFRLLIAKTESWRGSLIKPVKVKNVEILSEARIADTIKFFINVSKYFLIAVIVYTYVTMLFSFFHFTRNWAETLFKYILYPFTEILDSFINFLPNLFTILVILVVTRFMIKFIKFLFSEVESGTVTLPNFPQEWAAPTYKIIRFLVIAFAAIVIFPYLPGSDSEFFKGISIFLGILFSLGSTSAIANIVAGVVITYMRPFKIGDRVKIADTTGDIIEKTLLVTRLRTIKNVDVTIPNAMVLGSHIINFSSSSSDKGLILNTTVTIGYDVPWKDVHACLISAAAATTHILKEPAPFILQTALNDYSVSYELNAYTRESNLMSSIYSDLHQNIQDKFNEAGIEIMSPAYSAVRDGNKSTIPENYLPENYKAPSFRVSPFDLLKNQETRNDE